MRKTTEKQEAKRAYTKPDIRRVTLKPEESLVAGCKTLSQSDFGAATCDANSCMTLGS